MKTFFLLLSITFCLVSTTIASSAINPDFTSKLTNLQQNHDKVTPLEPGEKQLKIAKIALTIGILFGSILLLAGILSGAILPIGITGGVSYIFGLTVLLLFGLGTILAFVFSKLAMRKSEKRTKNWIKSRLLKRAAIITFWIGAFFAFTINANED
jgi:sulfite exporter TauE/SafE